LDYVFAQRLRIARADKVDDMVAADTGTRDSRLSLVSFRTAKLSRRRVMVTDKSGKTRYELHAVSGSS